MMRSNGSSDKSAVQAHAVTSLSVAGFKSIFNEQAIEIRPLTLLAGANSSGKSSMMQPLLLLKQTMEALRSRTAASEWPERQIHISRSVLAVTGRADQADAIRRQNWHF